MAAISGYTKRYRLTNYQKFNFKDNNATWKARRQASNTRFYNTQAVMAGVFQANAVRAAGQVKLATFAVAERLQAEMKAKVAERFKQFDELYTRFDKTV